MEGKTNLNPTPENRLVGFNRDNSGEEFYLISNPATGLWTH